ncbi:acyl-CoA synthetase [Nitrospirillum sp. BR 11163]|uniref:acyl-CoA synthetase n=1 Tax=Nitrospirillum sp. BR 11163 TaxID=3104323 RepID=UPI002AFF2F5D|nr:acyl-CoA synthetase [Nitrospirillum sp. BR 11163]MEA1672183.1 acyl-CoA synthetase [Nitrospirillum sp. BR 11163]
MSMGISCLADVERIEAVPLAERNLPANSYEMIATGAALNPDAPALSFFLRTRDQARPYTLTHRALLARITQAAHMFRHLGIGRGDTVAILLPNLIETHLAIWGAETAGIAFPINPLLEADQIAALLRAADARLLVTLGPAPGSALWEKACAALVEAPSVRQILTVDPLRYLRSPLAPIARVLAARRRRAARLDVPVRDMTRALKRHEGGRLAFAAPAATDIASYFATGGTTGLPKIARRTHHSEVFDSWAMNQVLGGTAAQPVFFCGLPLFHVNGQLVTGLAPLGRGGHVVIGTPQGYRGEGVLRHFWEIVERHRIAFFSGVPTVYSTLLEQPVKGHDLSSLELGMCGAAPMPVELFRRFEQATGVRILEGYGLTEGACTSSVNPPAGERRVGSIGLRLPYQRMKAVILDDQGGYVRDAAVGEVGIIALNGPNVFEGYTDPAREGGTWLVIAGERWLNTGDLGRQDADGYFWLTGRRKELIIRGGHNIDPGVIQEALAAHPAVAMTAAVGRPDAHAGELPVAYVQLRTTATATSEELLAHACALIPERAAWPKAVRVLDALPLTSVGKVFKPTLVGYEIADVVRQEGKTAGLDHIEVDVVLDPDRGLLARIRAQGDRQALGRLLGRYTFAHEITD